MKKYLLIVVIAILIFTACGKKDDTSVISSSHSSSADSSSAEEPQTLSNPYFSQDFIYVPAELTFPDSEIKNEFNDKGWLVRSTGKGVDYEWVTELSYEEDGNIIYVSRKTTISETDMEPETEEESCIIFNDDGKTDKYETKGFGTLDISERDERGRATTLLHVDNNPEFSDYTSYVINYSEKNIYVKLKDPGNNTISTTFYMNCHTPLFADQLVSLPLRFYPEEVKTDGNGLVSEINNAGLKYSYDENQRITEVYEKDNIISTLTYNDDGKLASVNNSDTDSEFKSDNSKYEFRYDENGNISAISIYPETGSPEAIKIKYEKVPVSIAGLCSYDIEGSSCVLSMIDYDNIWDVPYNCFCYIRPTR
ncbi:MAG: hypothetical protein IJM14_08735 [Lachnospiraceae bacterium]|nr:hypothetical protein [Lachnospiraceae bacterium]